MNSNSLIRFVLTGLTITFFMSINSMSQDDPWWRSWEKLPDPQIEGVCDTY